MAVEACFAEIWGVRGREINFSIFQDSFESTKGNLMSWERRLYTCSWNWSSCPLSSRESSVWSWWINWNYRQVLSFSLQNFETAITICYYGAVLILLRELLQKMIHLKTRIKTQSSSHISSDVSDSCSQDHQMRQLHIENIQ